MRTQDEIVARINEIKDSDIYDIFGSHVGELLAALDYEHAQPFLKPGVTSEEWADVPTCIERDDVIAAIAEYLPFAWEKAEGHRGLSSSRSIDHMRGWAWLLGDIELKTLEAADYPNYGAPQLAVMAEIAGQPLPDSPRLQRMINGEQCGGYAGDDGHCSSGCGS